MCANPVREIKNIYAGEKHLETANSEQLSCKLELKAQDISVAAKATNAGKITINLYGEQIVADCEKNEISLGSNSMPLCVTDEGKIKIRIIADVNGVEIFAGYGQAHMCIGFLSDYSLDKLTVLSEGIKEVSVDVAELKDVH